MLIKIEKLVAFNDKKETYKIVLKNLKKEVVAVNAKSCEFVYFYYIDLIYILLI